MFQENIDYSSFIGNMTYIESVGEFKKETKKQHNSFVRLCSKYDTISPLDYTKESDTIRRQTWSAMIKFKDMYNRNLKLAANLVTKNTRDKKIPG